MGSHDQLFKNKFYSFSIVSHLFTDSKKANFGVEKRYGKWKKIVMKKFEIIV